MTASFRIGGINATGKTITVIDGKIFVDGVVLDGSPVVKNGIIEIKVIEGVVENVKSDVSITCGNVKGNVTAGTSVHCDCIGGDVTAGKNVNCGRVGGNINAGSSVRHA